MTLFHDLSTRLSTRLSALFDQNKAVLQLIHRLSKLNFGTTSDDNGVRLELTAEISETLKQLELELDSVHVAVDELSINNRHSGRDSRQLSRDSEKEREKTRIAVQVAKLTEDLRGHVSSPPYSSGTAVLMRPSTRTQFDNAQRIAKRNAEAAKRKERELLFAGARSGASTPTSLSSRRRGKDISADEVLVNASSDVTSALRRTHQLMQSELSRSRFAQETLEQSTAALADLGDHYTSLDDLLSSSRSLLTNLVKSQKSDTWYLETAFYILVTTIIWLVFRRFLYGPLWWFLYLPLKYTYKLVLALLSVAGVTGGTASTTSVAISASQSASLIVKPSATGRPPARMPGQQPYMRAGGGGQGAKSDPSDEGSMSRQVGQMAESAQQQEGQQEQQQGEKAKDVPRRGDGQPLVESDKPRNPKKRMWDEDVENAKREAEAREKDEL
ncbi:Sec20-domain-containing protein [Mytilinidion resinicola]|uniref:Sec20-domain-containing protein n=1 Tax=Mytilinidion resinicola TaxID=574789 RepID=A0A6A6YE01_9PEZI|nr:Sec20-domain-containing protein [Mytilinidion resinicola]KAF2806077.1 Sec20-domain-containing protein [Mytilinidion resinicola]